MVFFREDLQSLVAAEATGLCPPPSVMLVREMKLRPLTVAHKQLPHHGHRGLLVPAKPKVGPRLQFSER
jgi:hypothetical protein